MLRISIVYVAEKFVVKISTFTTILFILATLFKFHIRMYFTGWYSAAVVLIRTQQFEGKVEKKNADFIKQAM